MRPNATEAERQLAKCVIADLNLWPAIDLEPAAFAAPNYAAIWRAGVAMSNANRDQSRTYTQVLEWLRVSGDCKEMAGLEHCLSEIVVDIEARDMDARISVQSLASIVKRAARLRVLQEIGGTLKDAAGESDADADRIGQAAQDALSLASRGTIDELCSARDIVAATVRDIQTRNEGTTPAMSTGIKALDIALDGGLEPDSLIIIAGRPGMGKTAMGMQLVTNAVDDGGAGLVFTMEMGKIKTGRRLIATRTGVPLGRLKQPSKMDMAQAAKIIPWVNANPAIDFVVGRTDITKVRAVARRWRQKRKEPKAVIMIDYLQLMDMDIERGGNREQAIAKVTRECKLLSGELDVPILLLSQLNRGLESRSDKRPTMSDLRESGAIEQDADVIMFPYRDWVYNKSSKPNECEVIFGKNREGAAFIRTMIEFHPELTKFADPPQGGDRR